MKSFTTVLFSILFILSSTAQKLEGDYKRPSGCASCSEFLSLKANGTYTRVLAFDWGDNEYSGTWKLMNNKLILTEKDTSRNGFYWNKEFCFTKKEGTKPITKNENIFIPDAVTNAYYLHPCEIKISMSGNFTDAFMLAVNARRKIPENNSDR